MILRIENIKVVLNSVEVLRDVEFEVREGELIALLGPNGSGKSTLLRTIFGLIKPACGAVYLNGRKLHDMQIAEVVKSLGYLPQENSETKLRVIDVVLLGRTPYIGIKPSWEDLEIAREALSMVGMGGFENRRFSELSGGEKQKVMLARIFCQQAKLLLLDEPTSHLDIKSQIEVMGIVKRTVNNGKAAIVAIHDINLAASFCNRILMVKNGKIFYAGRPTEIINAESIMDVFGIEVEVIHHKNRIFVVPQEGIESAGWRDEVLGRG
ncbi:ABC transporter ATP-binding protein [Archaeoglobus veneficus]|uniref:Phosphonate-transporting ATPase n=1 Tax=Archaeoglobus veneficus (strain DSM 11195 / SNP6) TaxID=693661 RepID=F2KSW8_ARCVS|nr:ABC transporter ATP-binding protein [Archaeoglobus veneficus]AEA47013.1 Phosphonate-transporting ATPase [Archaeoglobus veneficus SNP6]